MHVKEQLSREVMLEAARNDAEIPPVGAITFIQTVLAVHR